MRPTRALVSRSAFLHNLRYVRKRIGAAPVIMAVIKANAYGHGLEIIANASVESNEVGYFGVATEEEGVALRKLTTLPIQVLTTSMNDEIDTFIANDLDFTLCDGKQLDAIIARATALGKKARIHLKVDTGMRRIGVEPQEALSFAQRIASHSDVLDFVGVATHYATSDEIGSMFFAKQLGRFREVVASIRGEGIAFDYAHGANSGAILQDGLESSFDMVRPGIMLYGYAPSMELHEEYRDELRPVLDLVSSVGFTKKINKGEGVSYNLRWTAEHDTTIATIPVGYGDGYSRSLSGKTSINANGTSFPVRGTICMDQLMIETGNVSLPIGEDVTLLSTTDRSIDAWAIASRIGTIPYEVLTNITARVPRIER